jgi:hypothetical protein
MNDAKELAKNLINRARTMQEFTVTRDENCMFLNGVVRYDIRHKLGEPYYITVPAVTQAEAEQHVDTWIAEMRVVE